MKIYRQVESYIDRQKVIQIGRKLYRQVERYIDTNIDIRIDICMYQ